MLDELLVGSFILYAAL